MTDEKGTMVDLDQLLKAQAQIERLEAEVERLTTALDFCARDRALLHATIARLKYGGLE